MGWIDVAIPGLIGFWLAFRPETFSKPSGNAETDEARFRKFRVYGLLLLGVAAIYLLIKMGSS